MLRTAVRTFPVKKGDSPIFCRGKPQSLKPSKQANPPQIILIQQDKLLACNHIAFYFFSLHLEQPSSVLQPNSFEKSSCWCGRHNVHTIYVSEVLFQSFSLSCRLSAH